MIEDGVRLSYSIFNENANVVNMLSGETLIVVGNNIVSAKLDTGVVVQHIRNLTELLLTSKYKKSLRKKHGFTSDDNLTVREENHNEYTISYQGCGCTVKDNIVTCYRGFDFDGCVRVINGLLSKLIQLTMPLEPKRDIVRRIADVGVLVWVYNGHSVVTYERNVMGNYMFNCLIDGKHYPSVVVSTSRAENSTCILDSKLELVLEFPLDKSIESYYPCDDEVFDI